MKINCDIEFALYGLMMLSSQSFDRMEEFKDMAMHNKIECAISDLKKFRPALYEEYKDELQKLWMFKEYRNMICHRRMVVNEDLTTYKFLYFDRYNGQVDQLAEVYPIDKTLDTITLYYKLFVTLTELNSKLIGLTNFPLK
ncbi:MAG: hypothetical protein NTW29_08450 [Bacteroidetes bacterium]|nr:hypothetical protein [Bacteroidota bacterium]